MTMHSGFPPDIRYDKAPQFQGQMDELGAINVTAILLLRGWDEGAGTHARMAHDLGQIFPSPQAAAIFEDITTLMRLVLSGAGRKLACHDMDCAGFGDDESAFATMVAAATVGDFDDAVYSASTFLTGHDAFDAASLARRLAQPFLRLARHSLRPARPAAASQVH